MKQLTLLIFLLHIGFCLKAQSLTQNKAILASFDFAKDELEVEDAVMLSKKAWKLRRSAPSSADSLAQRALEIAQPDDENFYLGTGLAQKVLGYVQSLKGNKITADSLYREAVKLLSAGEDYKEEASVWLLLGNLSLGKGALDEAIEYYYRGIRLTDNCSCEELRAVLYTMVADVKIQQKKYEVAQKYYYDAIQIQRHITNAPQRLASTYYSLGSLYAKTGTLDSALVYYEKAITIFKATKDLWQLSTVYGGKGNVYFELDEFDKAFTFYKEGLELKEKVGDISGIAHAKYQIGNLLYEQGTFEEAKTYVFSALDMAREHKIAKLIPQAYRNLSEIEEKLNAPERALSFYKNYIDFRDTLLNKEKEKEIKEVEEKYQNEELKLKNEQQAAVAKLDKVIRNIIIGVLVLLIFIAFMIARHYQQKRKTALKMAQQQEKLYQQEVLQLQQAGELRAMNASQDGQEKERKRIAEALHNSMGSLLSAIQMHFQTISETITFQQNDTEVLFNKSLELIREAAVTNRDIAHEMMPPILMKFGLGASLDSLAEKMKSPGVNVSTAVFGLEKRLPEELELSLYRIIDELINNIIKHAKASEISIQLIEHEDMLNVIVEDNGRGFNYNPNNKNYGMGLNNIMTRVNHFAGSFEIDSSVGNGTTIIINIPQKTYRKELS